MSGDYRQKGFVMENNSMALSVLADCRRHIDTAGEALRDDERERAAVILMDCIDELNTALGIVRLPASVAVDKCGCGGDCGRGRLQERTLPAGGGEGAVD